MNIFVMCRGVGRSVTDEVILGCCKFILMHVHVLSPHSAQGYDRLLTELRPAIARPMIENLTA